jgi:hypothetical protein
LRLSSRGVRRYPTILLLLIVAACDQTPSDQAPAPAASATPSASSVPSTSAAVLPDFTPPTSPSSAPPESAGRQHLRVEDLEQKKLDLSHSSYARMPTRAVDGMFLLVAAEPSAPMDAADKGVHDTVTALFHGPLAHRTDRAVLVWVFDSPDRYRAFLQERLGEANPRDLGYYDTGREEISVCTGPAGPGSLDHEIAHVLISGDFPLGPLWLQEGLAAQLELADFNPPGEVHGKAHFRLQTLRTLLASPDKAPGVRLDAVFALAGRPELLVGPNAYIAYAMSREALRWLDSRHQLWRFYRAWRDGVLDDPTGEKAFVAVVGKTPREATPEWVAWARSPEAERP